MRSGNWRGLTIALGLSCVLAFSATATCRADLFHTIPDLVPAVDVNTGGPYYAPPIPYGHYTGKNIGGKICGLLHGGLLGHGVCGACGGKGCGLCGGNGNGGGPCANGNGLCGGGHGAGDPCGSVVVNGGNGQGCGLGHGHGHGGLFHKNGSGLCGHATTAVVPSPQGVPVASEQCAEPGCGLGGKHHHKGHGLCGACGGLGSLGGLGCGLCHGSGLGNGCACGGKGCGLCGGNGNGGGTGCGLCGGKGCGACAGARGMVNHLLGRDKIKWFVGPGGPVPLTPGYTPYVVTTRSPRDFLAFPPFVP